MKKDLSEHAIKQRLSRRGRHTLLSVKQEYLVCGFILYFRSNGKIVSSKDVMDFIHDNMEITVKPNWVTHFKKRRGFSTQKVVTRFVFQFRKNYLSECIQFVKNLRKLEKSNTQIWCMDEKGVWSNESP